MYECIYSWEPGYITYNRWSLPVLLTDLEGLLSSHFLKEAHQQPITEAGSMHIHTKARSTHTIIHTHWFLEQVQRWHELKVNCPWGLLKKRGKTIQEGARRKWENRL